MRFAICAGDGERCAMTKPVVGVIANSHRVEERIPVQMAGGRNLRAVAEVAGALPLEPIAAAFRTG